MADSAGVLMPKPTDVYVGPLLQIETVDVSAGIKACDRWLRSISHDIITIERLEMVANALPVVANIMSAVDLVLDIKDLIEHHQQGQEPDLFDWINLGLDLIGIIPIPPATSEFRMGARPVLKLVRQKILESGKAIGEATIQVMQTALLQAVIDSLSEQFAGRIQSFVDGMKSQLDGILKTCADYIEKFLNGFADLFAEVAGEKALSTAHNYRAADQHASQIADGFSAHDARKTFSGLGHLIVDFVKIEAKGVINSGTQVAKALDLPYREALMKMANLLRGMIPTVKQRIIALGGVDAGTIGWLINLIQLAIEKKRDIIESKRRHATGVKESGTTRVHHEEGEGRQETIRHTEDAEHPGPNQCKLGCPVSSAKSATRHSVGYALGDERLDHPDFALPGTMPVVWSRTYRSFFDANDETGETGARWITPYTTRIDIHAANFVYHDATGRSVKCPRLAPGEAHDDRGEGFTLLRLDETWLTLTRAHDTLEAYEKHGDAFRLAFIKDRAGNQITLDYDPRRRLARLIAPQAIVAFLHDDAGRIVEAVHHDREGVRVGTLARYAYDRDGDLVTAFDEYDNRREYRYHHHLLTHYTDRTGRGMHLEWNGTGARAKCVREYADDGSFDTRFAWHPDFRMVSVTDAHGSVTRHYYDRHGYTFRIIHPDGGEEWMYRDANHNLVQHTYADGGVERMHYDARDNLVRHQRVDGSVLEMHYDAKDQMVRLVDPQGHAWQREYDEQGNVSTDIDPLGHKTRYVYDGAGRPVEVTDAKGGTRVMAYDDAGQLASYTDCSGKTSTWTYDAGGRLLAATDAAGGTTAYRYAANGTLEEVSGAAGVERFQYDAEGRLLARTDALQRVTRFAYDAAGRIGTRIDAAGHALSYGYDRIGRLVRLTDANHASFQFRYDALGRLLETVGFDGKLTRYEYDADSGQLASIDDAGRLTQVEYDRGGRLVRRVSGEVDERFAYDALGRLIDARNAHSRVQHFYDPVGNLVREHHASALFGEARSVVWHHAYDEIGARVRTVRPDGHRVDWLTYGSGYVHGMVLDGDERVQFERDDLHREVRRALPGKLIRETTRDPAGRLAKQTVQREDAPSALASRHYRYDAASQLTQVDDSRAGPTGYRYDPVGRLIEAVTPNLGERFAFDPAGNFVDAAAPGMPAAGSIAGAVGYVPPGTTPAAPLPRVLGNLLRDYAGTHFEYDAQGNVTEKRSPGRVQRFEWDSFNRLVGVRSETVAARTEARYFYDAFGRRIARVVDGQATVFGWDGDTLAYESGPEYSRHYLYEAGTFVPLAQYTGAPVAGMPTPVPREHERYTPEDDPLLRVPERGAEARLVFYHCDQIGTPRMITDELGEIVWEARYKAWGEALDVIERVSKATGELVRNPLRFQGQHFDDESGLAYNRHRYYAADVGRYVSKDPAELLGGLNELAYVPNPVQWIDPLGLAGTPAGGAGSAGGAGGKPARCPKCNPCEGRNPTATARSWQGSDPYSGVDSYQNVVVKRGTVLYTLYPHGPAPGNYFVTSSSVLASSTAREYNDSVQVAHKDNWDSPRAFPMRTQLHAYIVAKDTCVAKGKTGANPHLGGGGGTQYFVENQDKGNLIDTGKIIGYSK
ncbi:RHS repeat-associated core domain-containing protein [Burkholderia plantarii]|uniref:Rhs family protein n=1 Tax=Burkholderia plantarii TaxID=41899 RepID=A0A0B6S4N2_BURPL|nr:RHS repeat-associated core domain-containing protein [Burkholderia plantarii]AJK47191.1 Rhs family protein [Burkholderia plantarii]